MTVVQYLVVTKMYASSYVLKMVMPALGHMLCLQLHHCLFCRVKAHMEHLFMYKWLAARKHLHNSFMYWHWCAQIVIKDCHKFNVIMRQLLCLLHKPKANGICIYWSTWHYFMKQLVCMLHKSHAKLAVLFNTSTRYARGHIGWIQMKLLMRKGG